MRKSSMRRLSGAVSISAVATFVVLGLLYGHWNDRCRGALFDDQFARALGLNEQQAEYIEELGGSLEQLCSLDQVHLSMLVASLAPENETVEGRVEYLRRQYADDAGKIDPNGLTRAMAQREQMLRQRPERSAAFAPDKWTALGPVNIPGRVAALAVDPTNSNRLLMGSAQAGLWISMDEGRTWSRSTALPTNQPVSAIAFGSVNKSVVYASVSQVRTIGNTVFPAYSIYKSTDAGVTWSALTSTSTARGLDPATRFDAVFDLTLSPVDDNTVFAVNSCAILKSSNGGESWTTVYSACNKPVAGVARVVPAYPRIDPNDAQHIVAGGTGGVVISRDGGATWSAAAIAGVDPDSYFNPYFAASAPGVLYAGTYYGDAFKGKVFKSTDGGASWALVSDFPYAYGQYTNQIWVDPGNANLVLVGGVGLWRSTDGGAHFTQINGSTFDAATSIITAPTDEESPHPDQHAIAIPPNFDSSTNRKVFIGNDGGVIMAADIAAVTKDSGWQLRSGGLSTAQFYGIGSAADGSLVLAGAQDTSMHAYGGGAGWRQPIGGSDGTRMLVDQTNPLFAYAGFFYGGIYATRDGGASWKYILGNTQLVSANFVPPILLDPNNQRRLFLGAQSLWVAADASVDTPVWTAIKPPSATSGNNVSAIAVAPSDSNVIWVGHNNGEIYRTTDGQAAAPTWTRVTSVTATRAVASILIDPGNASRVFVGYEGLSAGNIIATTDAGATWSDITGNLPQINVKKIIQDPLATDTLYIGTGLGVYASTTGGTAWTALTGGPEDGSITDMAIASGTGGLLVATFSSGAFVLADAVTPQPVVYPAVRAGAVFSSAAGTQTGSQSYIRFLNTGITANTVTATLIDPATGRQLGQWNSPTVPAGAQVQYFIGELEGVLDQGAAVPINYALNVTSRFPGYFQHVLYRPADGTLTNLTTCGAGVTAHATQVSGVHSSLIAGFPSQIVVSSADGQRRSVTLGVYDARNGTRLGSYTTARIPSLGQVVVSMTDIEAALGINPSPGIYHYIIRIDSTFTGQLQHLVNNLKTGVVSDMTTVCALSGQAPAIIAPTVPSASATLKVASVYSTKQSGSQSYIRALNTGKTTGTVFAQIFDGASGSVIGPWLSDPIPAGAERQFSIADIEASLPSNLVKPDFYTLTIAGEGEGGTGLGAPMTGYLQHVLYRPADGTLTNLSTCRSNVTTEPSRISGVHSSVLAAGFPSSVVVNNTGTAEQVATLGIYDARNGTKLGNVTTPPIAPSGFHIQGVAAIEAALNFKPDPFLYHYVVAVEGPFTGFLQHLVNNVGAGVITDMTTQCALPAAVH